MRPFEGRSLGRSLFFTRPSMPQARPGRDRHTGEAAPDGEITVFRDPTRALNTGAPSPGPPAPRPDHRSPARSHCRRPALRHRAGRDLVAADQSHRGASSRQRHRGARPRAAPPPTTSDRGGRHPPAPRSATTAAYLRPTGTRTPARSGQCGRRHRTSWPPVADPGGDWGGDPPALGTWPSRGSGRPAGGRPGGGRPGRQPLAGEVTGGPDGGGVGRRADRRWLVPVPRLTAVGITGRLSSPAVDPRSRSK